MNRRYLTTPIYYATGDPHLGHAYTTVLADTLARYYRQTGAEVRFLTGTDEHGQKMQETAAKRDMTPIELADQMAESFEAAWKDLNISFDRFIRTSEPEHIGIVSTILERLWAKGQIYDDVYSGWYCVQEERYWTEREVGAEHLCPDCKRPVEFVEEKNYFFRMSNYQERLIEHIEQNPEFVTPQRYRTEVLSFLREPLEDLCISRPKSRLQWGIPLTFDEDYVTYVWFDALINYVSALEHKGADVFDTYWPCCNHLIAKDILKPHAVYWPTMLMASNIPLPKSRFQLIYDPADIPYIFCAKHCLLCSRFHAFPLQCHAR